ncbi:MAG: selenocysteine-specific elongation factor [Micromonosporaceae bacterium]
MYVVATAGHVDHGKSTLLRALTGMEPDRWAQERDRGMTIDLGYVWTSLPSGTTVAFVDVPGHERFLGNMLAGVGPAPAVLFVVAADEGWMPQTGEHLAALDALGVRHGLLAITRSDLCDPQLALAEARDRLRGSSLARMSSVAVSAVTGAGLDRLREALDAMLHGMPAPDPAAPVRLWIDRAFAVKGSGTVVTGTLGAGTICVGDELQCGPRDRVRVRGLQTLQRRADAVPAIARVAVNLRGADRAELGRGASLLTPDGWLFTDVLDAWLDPLAAPDTGDPPPLPASLTVHIGSARVPARVRCLAPPDASGRVPVRLTLRTALPLHVGDRAVVRDANRARGARILGRLTIVDVRPPALRRRGSAAARGRSLMGLPGPPGGSELLAQHGVLRRAELVAMGCAAPGPPLVGDWLVDPGHAEAIRQRLREVVGRYLVANPLEPGMPVEAARHLLDLPDRRLVDALVAAPLRLAGGRIEDTHRSNDLPAPVATALRRLREELSGQPFQAPEQDRLAALGLDRRALGAAVRQGAVLRVADGIVLLPGADADAARILGALPQPFTASAARQALNTSRRVVIPLLEMLDRLGYTERVDGTARRCRPS